MTGIESNAPKSASPPTGITIGNLALAHPVLLAPMSGVSDWPFRRMVRKLGGGLVVSEMVASRAMIEGVRGEMRKLSRAASDEAPFALQLAGRDPAMMAEAARIGAGLGAGMIDINLGCPARKVTGKAVGSALMREEALVARIFAAMRKAVDIPVSVKMRLGWDTRSMNAPAIARMAESEGLGMVTVHGRTRCDFFKGRADWRAVAAVRDATRLPLIVNGDIASPRDAACALAQSQADGVMIGRAAMGKPWLINKVAQYLARGDNADLREPDLQTRRAIMLEHLDLMLGHYGTGGLRLARKHIAAYTKGMGGAALMRQIANNTADAAQVFTAIENFFDAAMTEREAA